MDMKNQRKKGFTLIELLVVITIIGILAGIAFVGFGDVFGSAGRTVAQKNLKTIYESLAGTGRTNFPYDSDVKNAEEFVVWWSKKTKDRRPELWFISEDTRVKDLADDEEGAGVPSNIPDDAGDFDGEQIKALGYCIALPGDDADIASFTGALKSGAYPIMWSRGLDAGDGKWDGKGAWAGLGGHVLFSDSKVKWYDDTEGKDGKGVFLTAVNKKDGDKKAEPTSDISKALPEGWKIHKPE
jgi:prepilin-type N-terminal cleavage/methylation domain-containing protein